MRAVCPRVGDAVEMLIRMNQNLGCDFSESPAIPSIRRAAQAHGTSHMDQSQNSSEIHDTLDGFVALVINFNTAPLTARCVESLIAAGVPRILVLDNASADDDRSALENALAPLADKVRLLFSPTNLGFAGGSNLLLDHALSEDQNRFVVFLNSDAEAVPCAFRRFMVFAAENNAAMSAARMVKASKGDAGPAGEVESLGISLYRSLLASNRKSTDDVLIGPTGGCAIFRRDVLEHCREAHGYFFDPDYFCYAEDTDLCLRARLMGYAPHYFDETVAGHVGQASSGDGFNDFVLYHGIRNSIWTMIKTTPLWGLVARLPIVLLLHLGIVARHGRQGKWHVVGKLYRDALTGARGMLKKRRKIQRTRIISGRQFGDMITPRFYEQGYVLQALRQLLASGR